MNDSTQKMVCPGCGKSEVVHGSQGPCPKCDCGRYMLFDKLHPEIKEGVGTVEPLIYDVMWWEAAKLLFVASAGFVFGLFAGLEAE